MNLSKWEELLAKGCHIWLKIIYNASRLKRPLAFENQTR